MSETEKTPAKETSSKQPTPTDVSNRRITRDAAYIGAILIVVLAYFLWPKSAKEIPIRTVAQLPYVFNTGFYTTLNNYLHKFYHEKILVLYGPQGVGKTAGIFNFISRLNKEEGRLIIDFDFSQISRFSNIFDVTSYLQYAVIHSLQLLAKNSKGNTFKSILPLLSKYENICPQGFNPIDASFLKDPYLINVTKQFNNKLSYLTKSPQLASRAFFESLSSLYEVSGPIVFIHSPEVLIKSESKTVREVVQSLIGEAEKAALDGNLTVVFEISDQTAFIDGRFHPARYQYLLTEVHEFHVDNMTKSFIAGNHFTKPQLQDLIPVCKGNGGCYSFANALLNDGMALKDVITEIESAAKRKVYSSIATLNNTDAAMGFLSEIISKGYYSIEKSKENALHFLHHDVVSISNNTRLVFQNAAISKAARSLVGKTN